MERAKPTLTLDTLIFGDAFNTSPIGIAVENFDGQPLFVNPALCSMLGFSEEELRNKHCVDFSPREDAEKDWVLFQQLRTGSIDHYQLERRYFRRDGSLIWGSLSISLLRSLPSPIVLAMMEDITAKETSEEALSRASQKLIQAQEQERSRLARELHDDINQRLAMLAVKLEGLKRDLPMPAHQLERHIEEMSEQLADVGKEIQALSHRLHSPKLELMGLANAASSFCKEFSDRRNVEIDFQSENIPRNLEGDLSLCLYRVLQEALQNAAKHSGSRQFRVLLRGGANEIELIVRDSGLGFDPKDAIKGDGLGLTSMRERLKLLDGELSIHFVVKGGTTVQARVPLTSGQST